MLRFLPAQIFQEYYVRIDEGALLYNGMEDYEYLTLAKLLLGEECTDRIIGKITRDLEHYTLSDAQFAAVSAK